MPVGWEHPEVKLLLGQRSDRISEIGFPKVLTQRTQRFIAEVAEYKRSGKYTDKGEYNRKGWAGMAHA
jgi:hypothetical protein